MAIQTQHWQLTLAEAARAGLPYSTYVEHPQDPEGSPGWRYGATLEDARLLSMEETNPQLRLIHGPEGSVIERHIRRLEDGKLLGKSGDYRGKLGKLNGSIWSIIPFGMLASLPAAVLVAVFPELIGQEIGIIQATLGFFGTLIGVFALSMGATWVATALGLRSINRKIFKIFEEITDTRATTVEFTKKSTTDNWILTNSESERYELSYRPGVIPTLEWRYLGLAETPVDSQELVL